MEYRKPQELQPHPTSAEIYGDNHLDGRFVEDIREHGIRQPLIISEDNIIISGHRRWRVANLLKLESVPVEIITAFTDDIEEKRAILANNLQREKVYSQKMKEAGYWKVIETHDAKTRSDQSQRLDRASDGTFKNVSSERPRTPPGIKGKTNEIVGQRVGIGKAKTFRRAEKVWQGAKEGNPIAQKLVQQLDNGSVSIKKAYRILTSKEREETRNNQRKLVVTTNVAPVIACGDFRELIKSVGESTIDLILTDPPYPKEYLPLWTELAKEASRVLKPGAFLISYSGQTFLPEVIRRLQEHLDYYWLGMLYHQGITAQRFEVNMWNRAKPILFFYKPPRTKQMDWLEDVIVSEKPDKELHDWGQNVKPFIKLLEHFSKPNDLILDPFMGGGATIEACIEAKRKIIGYEIDKAKYELVDGRLHG